MLLIMVRYIPYLTVLECFIITILYILGVIMRTKAVVFQRTKTITFVEFGITSP